MNKNTLRARRKGMSHHGQRVAHKSGNIINTATAPFPMFKGEKCKTSSKETGKEPRRFDPQKMLNAK